MTQPSRRKGGLGRGPGFADPDRSRRRRLRPATLGPRMGDRGRRRGDRWTGAGRRRRWARSTARSRRPTSKRNPRQPRQVFDDEALAELVHSIREFGLLQPIVVRAVTGVAKRCALPDRDGGAAVAGGPRGRPGHHPGHRARDRRRQSAARRPPREHPPGPAEPVGRGGGLPAAARRVRCHPRRTGVPHRPVASADHQHDPVAQAADPGAASGGRRGAVRRSCASAAVAGGRARGAGGTGQPDRCRGPVGAGHRGGGHVWPTRGQPH